MDFLGVLCKNDFLGVGQENSSFIGQNNFRIPLISTTAFSSFLPILSIIVLFLGPLFGPAGGWLYFHWHIYIRTRVENPAEGRPILARGMGLPRKRGGCARCVGRNAMVPLDFLSHSLGSKCHEGTTKTVFLRKLITDMHAYEE